MAQLYASVAGCKRQKASLQRAWRNAGSGIRIALQAAIAGTRCTLQRSRLGRGKVAVGPVCFTNQGRCCLHTPTITNLGQIRPPPAKASLVRSNHRVQRTRRDVQDSSTSNVQEVPGGASHPVGVFTGLGPTEVKSPGQTVYGPVPRTSASAHTRRSRDHAHRSWRLSSCASWR